MECLHDDIVDGDIGQMYLAYNKILMARSSSQILFFRLVEDEDDPEIRRWKNYHTIEARGMLFYIKGNVRIQIITDEIIYFYAVCSTTLMPTLQNVMLNHMKCNMMIFGPKVRYGVTYKTN